MSFLAPFFMLGALAIALPIVFHLIRRTSREKVPFSSLMFLAPTPPRVTRRSRLENIWLLLLRCLVLCLLALGFARPFLQRPTAADSPTGEGKTIAILLDTSASMQRENLWADAQAKAREFLRRTSPLDAVAVFAFDQSLHPVMSFEQWSAAAAGERVALATKRIDQTQPGWSSTHLGNSLIALVESLEDTATRNPQKQGPRQIILISDLQEGGRLDGLQGFEWPRGLEVIIEPVKARRPTNAGLQRVADREDAEAPTLDARPRVRISNSADAKREQFQIGWAREGEKGLTGPAVDIYVPPGQSRTVQAPKTPDGLPEERLVLVGDDEVFDNATYLVPPQSEQVPILYLGNESEKDPVQPLYYVKRAFQQTRRQTVQVLARPASAPLAQAEIDRSPLMIVTDLVPENRLKAVQDFLADGKTVLFAMKSLAAAQTLGRITGIDTLAAEEAATNGYAMLEHMDFEHPLFAPFAHPRFSDFTKIHFWKHRRLDTARWPGARILARFDGQGDPAMIQMPVGKGNLFVLTSSWHPADSQLALSSKFVPLLYSLLEQSGGIKAQLSQYVVGDTVSLPENASAVSPSPLMMVRKPDGSQVPLRPGEPFSQTDQPGIYTVMSAQPPLRFAVNLEPAESKTAPVPVEEIERLGVPVKTHPAGTQKQMDERRQHRLAAELENQQKLWRWLIVAALVVLALETALAGRLSRRAPGSAEAANA